MKRIKVLDVTLRDGGCVNNFNFGQDYMAKILSAEESAEIDIIELGYIDEGKGSLEGRTQYKNDSVISQCILKKKKQNITYVAMMDYGKYSAGSLSERTSDSVDGIRIAFHKEKYREAIEEGKLIKGKGYNLYIQPMVTLRYSDEELLKLINEVNTELPDASAFYIVDSFGEMRPNDMSRILNLVDHNLIPSIPLGFHSHNNLQLSYSNAMELLQFPTNRDIIVDCSIMGMGKGAGNLNTELLVEHLNLYYGKNYSIEPLLEVIDKVINQIHSEFYWGYSPEYYLSAINHCSPSYASYFYSKHMLPIDQVSDLLGRIAKEKKISFDREYAENLYREYNEGKTIDDSDSVIKLQNLLKDKDILLIAPGKSIKENESKIKKLLSKDSVVGIGLNTTGGFNIDYMLATRSEVYNNKELIGDKPVITTSHIQRNANNKSYVLDYKKWIDIDERTHDSSAVIALNFLEKCEIRNIYIAGMDGFSTDINSNYADPNMRRPVNSEQAQRRNSYYTNFIKAKKESGMSIDFVTPSIYIN